MAYSDNIEISNRGLRFVQIHDDTLIFAYEDGRTVSIIFTSSRQARKFHNENNFTDPNYTPGTFNLWGIELVIYREPGKLGDEA